MPLPLLTAVLGIDIWTVFLSFNTFFLGFSFLFGSGKWARRRGYLCILTL